jgi:hypothetical protein
MIKNLFSRKGSVCPIWIFILDTDQARISGETHATVPLKLNFMMFAAGKSMKIKIERRGLILKRSRGDILTGRVWKI